jgi:hypothetical protein
MNENELILCFPDGIECKINEWSFNDNIEIPVEETLFYKSIKLNNYNISFEGKIIDCDIKALKKLFRIKYPRKIKKKIFGTRRQRNKLFK